LPEWLVERGIGESRFVRVEGGDIVETRMQLDGTVAAGTRLRGRLKAVRPAAVVEADGQDYLLPKGAPGVAEGAEVTIEVTRELIPGDEPWKRALAKIATEAVAKAPAEDAQELPFPAPRDQLAQAGWWDLIDGARSGIVRFEGGELRMSPTPAMTLIDVDGYLSARELALVGAAAAARAILRHGIGGSIGIDFPTVEGKADRQEIAAAIDATLPQPFERTAVNGFGFLQIVRPRRHASLLELAQDRPAFEARALLRRAAFERAGPISLVAAPAVIAAIESKPTWIEQLARQVGGGVTLRADAKLPIHGGYAQAL
jgi:hypothetical protein